MGAADESCAGSPLCDTDTGRHSSADGREQRGCQRRGCRNNQPEEPILAGRAMSKRRINLSLVGAAPVAATPNLAVEVYDADLTLAARGTLGSGVELESDRDYIISATLPNGSRISKHAKLGPADTNVELKVPAPRQPAPP